MEKPVLPSLLSLSQAKSLSLSHSPILIRAREEVRLQEGRVREFKGYRRPRLDASGNYVSLDNERLASFGSPEATRWAADLEAGITLYSGGRSLKALRGQEAMTRAASSDYQSLQDQLFVQIHSLFQHALLAKEQEKVQIETIRVLGEQLQLAENRFTSGAGARFDVLQAEVALANAKPPLIRAKNDYRQTIDQLRRLIGLSYANGQSAQDIQLQEESNSDSLDWNLNESLAQAKLNRPELQSIEEVITARKYDQDIAGREHFPVVDLFAEYGVETDQFNNNDILQGWMAGTRFTWNWWDGGTAKGLKEQATAGLRQVETQKSEILLNIEGEVRDAFDNYEEAQSILQTTNLIIDQAIEALRLASNRYNASRGTQLDVLESQLALSKARLEQAQASHDLEIARIQILRAVGEKL